MTNRPKPGFVCGGVPLPIDFPPGALFFSINALSPRGRIVGQMKTLTKRTLYWTPRILGVGFALFISLFAQDVFSEGHGFWQTTLALGIHLIPTVLVLAALAVAWRWEWVGAVLFSGLGAFYVVSTWGRFHWSAYACIAGPLFLLGVLFWIGWVRRLQLRAS